MARLLSITIGLEAWLLLAIFGWSVTNGSARAEGEVRVTSPPNIVANPFVGRAVRGEIVPEEPPLSRRGPTTYDNPFARLSAAPPIEIPVRRGPVSRWRRPIVPDSDSSPIRTAILSMDTLGGPKQLPWNELPPAEDLRERRATAYAGADAPAEAHFGNPPDPGHFAGPPGEFPISQPGWLAARRDGAISAQPLPEQLKLHEQAARGAFGKPGPGPTSGTTGLVVSSPGQSELLIHPPAELDAAEAAGDADLMPLVISDLGETSKDWLTQAQSLAQSAESVEDLSSIVNLCERGLAEGPPAELSGPLRRLAAWAHNRRGELLSDQDRQQEAIRDFHIAISIDANCSLAIHNRAVTLAQQNEPAAALRDFNRVIELNPGLAIAYRNRAELLASLGRIEEALRDYTRAIDGMPDNAELYRGRGSAWHRAGDCERALADLNRAIELAPDADAYTERGNVAAERAEFDNALRDFQQALAIDPNWAEAYRSLAWLYATCANPLFRDPGQAVNVARKARDLSPPDDSFVLDALAAALASAGEFEEAVKTQQQAVAAAPRDFAEPLRQRLLRYQQGQPFVSESISAAGPVRAASHDASGVSTEQGRAER